MTLDGTWSGNLFDFYVRVYRKLVADLKIPFALEGGQRKEDTPVHIALREALVNTLVHADYMGRASIFVVKRPDMFGFRNPGLMRISVSQAIAGGESDGRNRTLQQMFLLIGAGERAGSGVPKILKGWSDQHWIPPALYERDEPSEQTLLELRMADLLPPEALDYLRGLFGDCFDTLSPEERTILVTAFEEQTITHTRVSTISSKHPTDLTRLLQALVQRSFLVQNGRGRGAVYHLPGVSLPSPDTVFNAASYSAKGTELPVNSTEFDIEGTDLSSEPLLSEGGRKVEGLHHLVFNSVDEIGEALRQKIDFILSPIRGRSKVPQERLRIIIGQLCENRYFTIKVLASLLSRDDDYLRTRHLNPMVDEGSLFRAFPQTPNDPRQAYTSSPPNQKEAK